METFISNKSRRISLTLSLVFISLLAIPIIFEYKYRKSIRIQETSRKEALSNFGFYFEETSKQSGIGFFHLSPLLDPEFRPILPQVASMGASVSVCDFDKDGWNDFYVTNSRYGSENALYHNQKDGSFINIAKQVGLANINKAGTGVSMGSVWADFDNDGYEDIFIYKWGRPELYRNDQGKNFIRVTERSLLPAWINSNTAVWFDYNSDGLIDLFIGGYYPENIDLWNLAQTNILTESFEYSQNGGRNYLFENRGNGTFIDVSEKVGLNTTRWTLAAAAADINQDGYPELIVANDFGIDEFYFNNNGLEFLEDGAETGIGFSPKSGMSVALGDVENNGQFGIYISNITEEGVLLQGNNFWIQKKQNNKPSYKNLSLPKGIENGGWSYGAQFGDLNNDGFIDLLVANGYISGKKGTDYWYDYSKVTGGNASIISDIKNWPAMNGRSHSGYQQNKIWMNKASHYFTDAAKFILDDQTFDSRAIALVDLWNRGVLDVLIANQNNKLLVFKNYAAEENNWIAFELEGTKSNRSAIGSIVTVHWNSQLQAQIISGGSGFSSQNQRRLHFGLGTSTKVDKIEILWASGLKQVIDDPEIKKLHKIKEAN